jgi:hypothetical protein
MKLLLRFILTLALIFIVSLLYLSNCHFGKKNSTEDTSAIDSIYVDKDEIAHTGKMNFFTDAPNVKTCFLALDTVALPIPPAFRLQMLKDYPIRSTFHQLQSWGNEKNMQKFEYEIDNYDSLHEYLMFSIFNKEREINFFLRYFKDSTENENHAVGISRIEILRNTRRKSCKYSFFEQDDSVLVAGDSIFPPITLRDFIADNLLVRHSFLEEKDIASPPLLVWMPQMGNQIGVDLNTEGFEKNSAAIKQSCRRTHLHVDWEEGIFEKEDIPVVIRQAKKNRFRAIKKNKRILRKKIRGRNAIYKNKQKPRKSSTKPSAKRKK